jgi:hypothetical protein
MLSSHFLLSISFPRAFNPFPFLLFLSRIINEQIDSTVMRFNMGCATDDAGSSAANDEWVEQNGMQLLEGEEDQSTAEDTSSSDFVIITIQNINDGDHLLINNALPQLEHVINCGWDEHVTQSVYCPSTDQYITRECEGKVFFFS